MALSYDAHLASAAAPDSPGARRTLIVLLHGGALSSRMFRTTIPHLQASGYEAIVCPDLPGHGKSKELGPFTFARSTELLSQLLSTLKADARFKDRKVLVVGVSLGGQAVLDLLAHYPDSVDAAVVCGASVRPPDTDAVWEMPHMPTEREWLDVMMEDVRMVGAEEAQALQQESLGFSFDPAPDQGLPPVLVNVGRNDVAMAKRDTPFLFERVKARNELCAVSVLEDAWHNHPVDVPEKFAGLVQRWEETRVGSE